MHFKCSSTCFKLEGYAARVSDKGFFARDTIEKFGTLAMVADLLRPNAIREMLLKYFDHIKPMQGVRDEGAVLNGQAAIFESTSD